MTRALLIVCLLLQLVGISRGAPTIQTLARVNTLTSRICNRCASIARRSTQATNRYGLISVSALQAEAPEIKFSSDQFRGDAAEALGLARNEAARRREEKDSFSWITNVGFLSLKPEL